MFTLQNVSDLISKAINSLNRNEYAVTIGNPYRQVAISVANGEIIPVFYSFNFCRILSLSNAAGVTLRFGSSGTPSDVVGAGIGYELPNVVDRVDIINNSGGAITITLALAIGRIYDDRLNISGNINVVNAPGTCLSVNNCEDAPLFVSDVAATNNTVADVLIAGTTTTQVIAGNAARKGVMISNLVANARVVRVGDSNTGSARGVEIPIGGNAFIPSQGAVYVYNTAAGNINIGVMELV